MNCIKWLCVSFFNLTWWQMLLWGAYFIYFLIRACTFWQETNNKSLWQGYKEIMFDYDEYFRVYHIFRIIFDIPPTIIGLFFPVFRKILSFKIYKFKKSE